MKKKIAKYFKNILVKKERNFYESLVLKVFSLLFPKRTKRVEKFLLQSSCYKSLKEFRLKEAEFKIHLGCGSNILPSYQNIDKYNPKADIQADAKELPYPDNTVDEIFTAHMVEHISYSDFLKALQEWKRVLKKGGRLIIRCPNFEKCLQNWLDANYEKRWGKNNEGINFITGAQNKGLGHRHRNLFTIKRLRNLVSRIGFKVLEAHSYPSRDGKYPDHDILLRAIK